MLEKAVFFGLPDCNVDITLTDAFPLNHIFDFQAVVSEETIE